VHGVFPGSIEVKGKDLVVNGHVIKVHGSKDPKEIKWGQCSSCVAVAGLLLQARDVLLQATTVLTTSSRARAPLRASRTLAFTSRVSFLANSGRC
jgi:glyceraldehyde-3-phosphate dehydrogenase/erythrose-4-phosphate dehydrogenase